MKTRVCIPEDIQTIFGKPPVLRSEDPNLYWELVNRLVQAIQPKDIIEWLWLKDIADYSWEAWRLQRFKSATIHLSQHRAVETVMRRLVARLSKPGSTDVGEQVNQLTFGWFNDPKANQETLAKLKAHGMGVVEIDAEAFTNSVDKLQAIDGLLGIAAVRRDASFREIERKREAISCVISNAPLVEAKVIKEVPKGNPRKAA